MIHLQWKKPWRIKRIYREGIQFFNTKKLNLMHIMAFLLSYYFENWKRVMSLLLSLREKCPNTEPFLVRISCIRTEYGDLLCKCPYSEKYGPEKTPYLDTFHAVFRVSHWIHILFAWNQLWWCLFRGCLFVEK